MDTITLHGCTLITGASSGLGEEFARQLAPVSKRLFLVARRGQLLDQLSAELTEAYPHLQILTHEADLSQPSQITALFDRIEQENLYVDRLINNAGVGDYGDFASSEWSRVEAMLRLNIESLTHITHHVLPQMIAHGGGDILNVSSLASTLPIPDFAVYAATKAYVTSFSEALRIELRDFGIHCVALCPGPVHTGFGKHAQRSSTGERLIPSRECFYVPKHEVVSEALIGLHANTPRIYPGLKIALAALLITSLPLFAIRFAMGFRPRKTT